MNELRVLLDLVLVHRFDRRHDDDTRDLVIEVRHLRILIARHKVEAPRARAARGRFRPPTRRPG